MKKSDIFFYLIIGSSISTVFMFVYSLFNLPFWLWDLKECFSVMEVSNFLINHFHIILYISLTPVIAFLITRTVYKGYFYIKEYFRLKKVLKEKKIKEVNNIVIIDFEPLTAFNFGIIKRKIVLSKTVLNLKEKKYIFIHEKAHFKGRDSFKLFVVSILSLLFPMSEKIKKQFSLMKEVEADFFAKKDNVSYAKALLNFYTYKSSFDVPMANSYIENRIMYILGEKDFHVPRILYLPLIALFITIFSILFKTCFCGVM